MSEPPQFSLQSNQDDYQWFRVRAGKPVVFGRNHGDQLFESKKISKTHATISVSSGGAKLFVDGGNGMTVNGAKHAKGATVLLAVGDVIEFPATATLPNGKALPSYKLLQAPLDDTDEDESSSAANSPAAAPPGSPPRHRRSVHRRRRKQQPRRQCCTRRLTSRTRTRSCRARCSR